MSLTELSAAYPSTCERLLRTSREDRIGQGYLLVGDTDEDLARFASAWACVIACRHHTPAGDACGTCETCRRLADRTYPERIDVEPESKSRQIVVDAIRAFEHRLALATDREHPKIGIIAEAECMGEGAQNAFLKTLEEPPPNTVLLLCTTQPRRLLTTIRSRCQLIALRRNRNDYSRMIEAGLFPTLAPLRRNAGAAVGLRAAARLKKLFEGLMDQARDIVGETFDERWSEAAADDKALKKRLEQRHEARLASQYLHLRRDLEGAIHAWFLQQRLIAAGVDPRLLPHPEFLECLPDELRLLQPDSPHEADENLRFVDTLLRSLRANLNETLALEAFCLSVAEIVRTPEKKSSRRA